MGALAVSMLSGYAALLFAAKQDLAPAELRQQQIKRESTGYKKCRTDVLEAIKTGKISKKDMKAALDGCRESFPGISLYIDCKKSALEKAKEGGTDVKAEVAKCQKYLIGASFDSNQPMPVFVDEGRIYFAGVGLNNTIPIRSLAIPNFDCKKVKESLGHEDKAEYILFGNHPRVFSGFSHLPQKALAEQIGHFKDHSNQSQKTYNIAGFGRLFGELKSTNSSVFFPAAPCIFNRDLGNLFSGISIYYLLDSGSKAVIPYFGIAFFKKTAPAVNAKDTIKRLAAAMGEKFRESSKNKDIVFIAQDPLEEFDDDGDPKNLCRKPRTHQIIGAVKAVAGDETGRQPPQYLMLANIKNLCDHGDRLVRRLSK